MKDILIYVGALVAVIGAEMLIARHASQLGPMVGFTALGVFILLCIGLGWEYASHRDERDKFQRWFDTGWSWRITGKREPARIGNEWTTTRVAMLVGLVLLLVFVARLALDLV